MITSEIELEQILVHSDGVVVFLGAPETFANWILVDFVLRNT